MFVEGIVGNGNRNENFVKGAIMKTLILLFIFHWGYFVSCEQNRPFFLQLTEKWKSSHVEFSDKYIKFQDMQLSQPAFAWNWDSF